jgi:RNA polymerase sigma factor (sigma-70 family)
MDLATQIFAEHGPEIRAMIRQHVTGQDEEDEVYQNLYLSLVCHPPTEPPANVLAYLSTIVRNDLIDVVRQRRSRQQTVSRYADSQMRDATEAAPDERVTQTEEVQRVTRVIDKLLPARVAAVLIERYMYGYSIPDIASHLGVTRRTVSRYACVGLRRLRDALY